MLSRHLCAEECFKVRVKNIAVVVGGIGNQLVRVDGVARLNVFELNGLVGDCAGGACEGDDRHRAKHCDYESDRSDSGNDLFHNQLSFLFFA